MRIKRPLIIGEFHPHQVENYEKESIEPLIHFLKKEYEIDINDNENIKTLLEREKSKVYKLKKNAKAIREIEHILIKKYKPSCIFLEASYGREDIKIITSKLDVKLKYFTNQVIMENFITCNILLSDKDLYNFYRNYEIKLVEELSSVLQSNMVAIVGSSHIKTIKKELNKKGINVDYVQFGPDWKEPDIQNI